jgi:hypothetical protein
MLFLPLQQQFLVVLMRENLHHGPLGDRGSVDARRGADGDVSVCIQGMLGNMIYARAVQLDEFQVLTSLYGRQIVGRQDCGVCV